MGGEGQWILYEISKIFHNRSRNTGPCLPLEKKYATCIIYYNFNLFIVIYYLHSFLLIQDMSLKMKIMCNGIYYNFLYRYCIFAQYFIYEIEFYMS